MTAVRRGEAVTLGGKFLLAIVWDHLLCVRCLEVVRFLEGPLWEVSPYMYVHAVEPLNKGHAGLPGDSYTLAL